MASKPLRSTATIPLRPDGMLRLAVVADTHSRPHPHLTRQLEALAPDAILHAGDIGDRAVLEKLATIAPLHAVRGNIDAREHDLPDVLVITAGKLCIYLTHIAVNGPRLRADVARAARAQGATLIVCGHSHIPFIAGERGLTVFNPGSIGPRRFNLPILYGTIELGPHGVRLAHVDAETGGPWLPPDLPGLST
jgi:putative phosphoesterase